MASPQELQQEAVAAFRSGRLDEAEDRYRRLVSVARHPGLLVNLGMVIAARNRPAEAVPLFEESLLRRPGDLNARVALASALVFCDRPAEALARCDEALALDPSHVDARHNRAVALGALDRNAEAIAVLRSLLSEDPGDADAEFRLGVNELLLRDFANGWRHYEARWRGARAHPPMPLDAYALWRPGDDVRARALLAMAEQGLGDALHFMRWIPRLASVASRVELQVQPGLAGFVRRQLPDVAVGILGAQPVIAAPELRLPLMSLPLALGLGDDSDAAAGTYLHAETARVAAWRERLGAWDGPRIAFVWRGSPTLRRDALRSIALESLQPWLAAASAGGVQLLSLQRDATPSERECLRRVPHLVDAGPDLADFDDTAAVMAIADHVVSVVTAAIHLAGGMSRPATLLLQFAPDFRWGLASGRARLYPSVRLLRQPAPGDWAPAVRSLIEALP